MEVTRNFSIGGFGLYFTVRWYDIGEGKYYGARRLGPGRFALDIGRMALIFENLN